MFEVNSKIWQEDIETIIKDEIINSFRNLSILITGATGLIGKELVFSFLCANRIKNLNIKIVALVRNTDKAKEIFKNIISNSNFEIIEQDIINPIKYSEKIDFIFHCANITSSNKMIKTPISVIDSTLMGTKNVLEFARKKSAKVIYLSSLEIYGRQFEQKEEIFEEDYGFFDSSNIRNCYPLSKKMAENMCFSYSYQYDLDVKIARLTQTFGAGVVLNDNRFFSQLAKAIINNEEFILKTDGSSYKNYCYLTDTIRALFYIAIKGNKAEVYNVANYDSAISIKDLVQKLINKYKKSSLKFEIGDNPYNQNVYLKLNTKKLESLGFSPQINLEDMFTRLIMYLKGE